MQERLLLNHGIHNSLWKKTRALLYSCILEMTIRTAQTPAKVASQQALFNTQDSLAPHICGVNDSTNGLRVSRCYNFAGSAMVANSRSHERSSALEKVQGPAKNTTKIYAYTKLTRWRLLYLLIYDSMILCLTYELVRRGVKCVTYVLPAWQVSNYRNSNSS